MDEKEIKRSAFIMTQQYLEKAKEECEKSKEVKDLFSDKIEALLQEMSEEMLKQKLY